MPVIKYQTADGQLFDTKRDAEAHELQYLSEQDQKLHKNLNKFKLTYSYQDLVKNHKLDEIGFWAVHGEDPNCDFGGFHHEPYLGTIKGKLSDVINWAVVHPSFWHWGSGGSIRKVSIQEI